MLLLLCHIKKKKYNIQSQMMIQILIIVDYGNHAKCRLPLGIDKADKESFGSLSTVTMSDGGKIVCLILCGNGPKVNTTESSLIII